MMYKDKKYILLLLVLIIWIASIIIISQKSNISPENKYSPTPEITVTKYSPTPEVTVTKYNNFQEVRFIVVGDPHIKSTNGGRNGGNDRLKQIVNFVDSSDADFVVLLGDIADDGKNKTYDIAKTILKNMTKPYYVVAGNHDVASGSINFEIHFGPMEHIENFKGYQLLFPGIYQEGNKLHWSFDFNKTDKNKPTLVFLHGPTVGPPDSAISCKWGVDFFGYGQTMQTELNKFSNLLAEYAGHVHYDTDQTLNNVRYITVNGLVDKAGGCENEGASDYVGYSDVNNGKVDYALINYSEPFKDPFPN